MATQIKIPAQFKELQPFAEAWALDRVSKRIKKRLSSEMDEIQAFYDAMMPRLEEIIEYLNQYPLDNMPEDAQNLLYMCLSLTEISNCVELWRAPDQSESFSADRIEILLDD